MLSKIFLALQLEKNNGKQSLNAKYDVLLHTDTTEVQHAVQCIRDAGTVPLSPVALIQAVAPSTTSTAKDQGALFVGQLEKRCIQESMRFVPNTDLDELTRSLTACDDSVEPLTRACVVVPNLPADAAVRAVELARALRAPCLGKRSVPLWTYDHSHDLQCDPLLWTRDHVLSAPYARHLRQEIVNWKDVCESSIQALCDSGFLK